MRRRITELRHAVEQRRQDAEKIKQQILAQKIKAKQKLKEEAERLQKELEVNSKMFNNGENKLTTQRMSKWKFKCQRNNLKKKSFKMSRKDYQK
jgi:ribosomal protein L9